VNVVRPDPERASQYWHSQDGSAKVDILRKAMPIYEYRCDKRHTFEVMQRISDDPVTSCEVCGAPVQRVFHPIAVHFKGSGFYNTDYGTRKRSREMKEGKDGSKAEGSSKDSKTSSGSDGASSSSDSGTKKSEAKAAAAD
jgi:putative FmdB family regulatory protein